MAFKRLNRARMTTATTGAGTITLGSAVASPAKGYYQSFAAAGLSNGDTLLYCIEDGSNWEVGFGTYTASGTLLSRTLVESSTGSLLNLSGAAEVSCTVGPQDFAPFAGGSATGGATSITGGFTNPGAPLTWSSHTVSLASNNYFYASNTGSITITAPTDTGAAQYVITNSGTAGSITFSGFENSSLHGDTLDTTSGSVFIVTFWSFNGAQYYWVTKLV